MTRFRYLRVAALMIAVVGALDPSFTTAGRHAAVVSLASGPADTALLAQVANALSPRFTVLRSPWNGAAATVVVGAPPLEVLARVSGFVAGVADSSLHAGISIDRLEAPRRAPVASAVAVRVAARTGTKGGARISIALTANGVAVDHAESTVAAGDSVAHATLTFVPTAAGAAQLSIVASTGGSRPDTAVAETLVDVDERQWRVLFFDRRPSWMSTFVRRVLEEDPRFTVTSRVVTSRNVSTDAG
ncbi:MAG TPA: hypothetical protein VE967_08900, partial [Gemmatimonadaceae bacterium]|nr:hypothetical protein [Gemmatimonadaceae bacterium]